MFYKPSQNIAIDRNQRTIIIHHKNYDLFHVENIKVVSLLKQVEEVIITVDSWLT